MEYNLKMKDGTGREFDDELTRFLEWYLESGHKIYVPLEDSIHFSGTAGPDPHGAAGVVGVTIYRDDPFQVQLFTCTPNGVIPPHTHPNVDSYEVSLRGMEFDLHGETVLPLFWTMTPSGDKKSNLPCTHYQVIRVLPHSLHGAKAHETGGCFMSVQRWLNGVKPSSVGNDWEKTDEWFTGQASHGGESSKIKERALC